MGPCNVGVLQMEVFGWRSKISNSSEKKKERQVEIIMFIFFISVGLFIRYDTHLEVPLFISSGQPVPCTHHSYLMHVWLSSMLKHQPYGDRHLRRLDCLEALLPLLPIIHDRLGVALLGESFGHLIHLLLAVLEVVDADVADKRDAGTHGCCGPRLAVFHGDALIWLDTELFAGVNVDGWVRLG